MTDTNKIVFVGRVTKDCGSDEYSYTVLPNGVAKATVCIAMNKSFKSDGEYKDKTIYVDVVIWGKLAESMKPYLVKGKQIAVIGSLDHDRWEKDGQKFSKHYIVAESVQLLGGGNGETKSVPASSENNGFVQEDIKF